MLDIITNSRRIRNLLDFDFDFLTDLLNHDFLHRSNEYELVLDIKETAVAYEFIVEVPGINKEDIDINVSDDVLTITVDKADEIDEDNLNFLYRERQFGTISRSFKIPPIHKDGIKAKYENGILILTLPKDSFNEEHVVSVTID